MITILGWNDNVDETFRRTITILKEHLLQMMYARYYHLKTVRLQLLRRQKEVAGTTKIIN